MVPLEREALQRRRDRCFAASSKSIIYIQLDISFKVGLFRVYLMRLFETVATVFEEFIIFEYLLYSSNEILTNGTFSYYTHLKSLI